MQYQRCKAQTKEEWNSLQMKVVGHILEVWFQDKLNREKVKLNELSGESAVTQNELETGESCGLGAICKIYTSNEREDELSRVEQIVESSRESLIPCKRYYS